MKIGRFAILRPPLGDLGAMYYDHLRLIEKHVVLALIDYFYYYYYYYYNNNMSTMLQLGFVTTRGDWQQYMSHVPDMTEHNKV